MGKKDEKFTAAVEANHAASDDLGLIMPYVAVFKENRVFEAVINRVHHRWEPHGSVMLSENDIQSDDFKAVAQYFNVVRR